MKYIVRDALCVGVNLSLSCSVHFRVPFNTCTNEEIRCKGAFIDALSSSCEFVGVMALFDAGALCDAALTMCVTHGLRYGTCSRQPGLRPREMLLMAARIRVWKTTGVRTCASVCGAQAGKAGSVRLLVPEEWVGYVQWRDNL